MFYVGQLVAAVTLLETSPHIVMVWPATALRPAIMASTMRAQISAYSTALAPLMSRTSFAKKSRIGLIPHVRHPAQSALDK